MPACPAVESGRLASPSSSAGVGREQASQGLDCPASKQRGEREPDAEHRLHVRKEPNREKRVSADVEEVVGRRHTGNVEHAPPDQRETCLNRRQFIRMRDPVGIGFAAIADVETVGEARDLRSSAPPSGVSARGRSGS